MTKSETGVSRLPETTVGETLLSRAPACHPLTPPPTHPFIAAPSPPVTIVPAVPVLLPSIPAGRLFLLQVSRCITCQIVSLPTFPAFVAEPTIITRAQTHP